ncbi:uncharacterized protein LOC131063054 [Cryptomeria japonica]|uniref:uncharacterized protein LOC131063054 n=1 Tax=Cryptomeria japonica TaxID=3369 RepID=UPI0027DA72A1|nr:uncharacterized protein LOC131063054 [Cryptomeria japonica]
MTRLGDCVCTRGPVAACHVAGAGPPVFVVVGEAGATDGVQEGGRREIATAAASSRGCRRERKAGGGGSEDGSGAGASGAAAGRQKPARMGRPARDRVASGNGNGRQWQVHDTDLQTCNVQSGASVVDRWLGGGWVVARWQDGASPGAGQSGAAGPSGAKRRVGRAARGRAAAGELGPQGVEARGTGSGGLQVVGAAVTGGGGRSPEEALPAGRGTANRRQQGPEIAGPPEAGAGRGQESKEGDTRPEGG